MVFSNSWQDHLLQLRTVLNHMKEAGLTVKVGNCQFGIRAYVCTLDTWLVMEAWSQS